MLEPENKDVSSTGSNSESESEEIESERQNKTTVTSLDWSTCGHCKTEKREIDCLSCQEGDALNGIFHNEQDKRVVMCEEFKVRCLNKVVLKNVSAVLQETRGDLIANDSSNRSLRYAAYKQFIWWVFKKVGKGNKRVVASCVLWKMKELDPEVCHVFGRKTRLIL